MTIQGMTPLLNVEDVARSIRFYQGRLGFRLEKLWENKGEIGWAQLECAGIRVMLNGSHRISPRERCKRPAHADTVLYFYVDDVDALHTQLRNLGEQVGELENEFHGIRDFYLRDPDGYELGFGTPISTPRGVEDS